MLMLSLFSVQVTHLIHRSPRDDGGRHERDLGVIWNVTADFLEVKKYFGGRNAMVVEALHATRRPPPRQGERPRPGPKPGEIW